MRRYLARLWPVFLLVFALSFALPGAPLGITSREAIKARVQNSLDEVAAKTSPRVLVIPIRELIELSTVVYVEREMRGVAANDIDMVLVEIHTNGGRIDAMQRIGDALAGKGLPRKVPVVAFIDDKAFSAGAIISLACDRIYIAPNGVVGAASLVMTGPQGPVKLGKSYEEKMLSAYRRKAAARAKSKGHPAAIAVAMVDRSKEVTEVEIDGKREYLTEREYQNRRRELGIDELPFAEARKRMKVIGMICEKGELLTLDYEQAKKLGLAADVVDSRSDLFAAVGLKEPVEIIAQHNWSEHFFGFFCSMAVRGILLMLGLMGLYMEFKIPGFGFPGIFGLTCLGLFFFSQYFMGIADHTGLVVFSIGVALLIVEIFLIPGFGITGIAGLVCVVMGLFLAMQPFVVPDLASPWDVGLFKANILVLSLALVGAAVFMVLVAKYLPRAPFLKRIILTSQGPEGELRASATAEAKILVVAGARGKTISKLRPAGRAVFEEKLLDVVAEGRFIDEGMDVKVVKVKGNRIVVRKVE